VSGPIGDLHAARTLGGALRRIGYEEDAIGDLLGDDAFETGADEVPVHDRRLDDSPLATAIRLLFLQLSVSVDEAARAFGSSGVDALAATGLAEVGGEVVPHSRLIPVATTFLASDGFSQDADDPADYVASYTPTARICDLLTPRLRIRSALDVGTGSGIHAVLAAHHADHVVATDVNPRALVYTEINAALNDLANVECRTGSLFDPALGERFDLITCNAPYVVSPERRWAYRDTELHGDETSARVIAGAGEHLAKDGYATVGVSWLAPDEDSADERVREWVRATGCDAWILPAFEGDPLTHAAGWNSHLAPRREQFVRAVDEWRAYVESLGAGWVSEGVVVLHRREGSGKPTVRVDEIDEDDLELAGDQVTRAFANRELLGRLRRNELLAERPRRATGLRVEIDLQGRGSEIAVHMLGGTTSELPAPAGAAELLEQLDGQTTLRKALRKAGVAERPGLQLVRELLELGALAV
jgi:methylase of polypeptide subunit release factors